MITNFRFNGKTIFITAKKDGVKKSYQISDDKFESYNLDSSNFSDGEEYELDGKDILNLRYDGVLVMAILEELKELEDLSVASSILGIYLRNSNVQKVYDFIYDNNKNILCSDIREGDYISYVDEEMGELLVCKIVKNRDEEDECSRYMLFDAMTNTFKDEYFSNIEELINRYRKEYKFAILKTDMCDGMIPKQTEWYAIYDESYDTSICSAYLSVNNGKYSMRCEFTNEIYGSSPHKGMYELITDTYDELIFNLLKQYRLVLPLRECIESI